MLGTNKMRNAKIPFSLSDYYTLTVASSQDLGTFRTFWRNYDFSRIDTSDLLDGGYLRVLTSLTGYSIFNKQARL